MDNAAVGLLERLLRKGFQLCVISEDRDGDFRPTALEPIAAVGDPPADDDDRNGGSDAPPERQDHIRQQAKHSEGNPEDLFFH